MVCLDLSSSAEDRVALAATLASRFGSRLIGIAAEEAALPYLEDGLAAARSILVENARTAAMEELARAETNFRRGAGHLPDIEWRSSFRKPLIFSEFGAGAKAGYHDAAADPHKFSEEYQAEYYRQTLAMARKVPFLRGMTPWILKDFRSPRRQHPVFQQGWNRKGLIAETGQRKKAFGVLAQAYEKRQAQGR